MAIPTFTEFLSAYVRSRRDEKNWHDKSEADAILAAWISLPSIILFMLAIGMYLLGLPLLGVGVAWTVLNSLLLPICYLLGRWHLRKREKTYAFSDDPFDQRLYAREKFQIEIKRINGMSLNPAKRDKLILEANEVFKAEMNAINIAMLKTIAEGRDENEVKETAAVLHKSMAPLLLGSSKEDSSTIASLRKKRKKGLGGAADARTFRERWVIEKVLDLIRTKHEVPSELFFDLIRGQDDKSQLPSNLETLASKESLTLDDMIVIADVVENHNLLNKDVADFFVQEIYVIRAFADGHNPA